MKRTIKLNNKGFSVELFVGVGLALIGLVFFIAGLVCGISQKMFLDRAKITEAEISLVDIYYDNDGSECVDVYVTYTVDDVEYSMKELNIRNSDMHEGETIEIYYDTKNPDKMQAISTGYTYMWGFGGVGLGIMLFGGFFIAIYVRNGAIKKNGYMKKMPVKMVDVCYPIQTGGRMARRVICYNPNPKLDELNEYRSHLIWDDVVDSIDCDDLIPVYIDKNNPKKYFMDVDEYEKR